METSPPQTRNIKYNLSLTQLDEPPKFPVTSLINVNISNTNDTPCTWFPVKPNSGPHNSTYRSDATITPEKRDDDRTTQFSSVSSPTPNTSDVASIQTSAHPLSKMGRYTTNNPPVPCTDIDLQGRGILRRGARLDANNTD